MLKLCLWVCNGMMVDKLLIWRCRRGSREALRQIYEKYHVDLFKLAIVLTGDSHPACGRSIRRIRDRSWVPSVWGWLSEFEGCVYRFGDTSGEGDKRTVEVRACHHCPLPVGKGSSARRRSQEGASNVPRGPHRTRRRREPPDTDGWSTLRIRPATLSPRWYPQRTKRTPRTRPAHDARATTAMHPHSPFCAVPA
jgi:hypothetical protein